MSPADHNPGLHRFAVALAGAIVLLIAAGALVKSKEAGLAVPDWPLSYGSLNPPRWWQIENVRAEHGHRLFAGSVAALTVVLALWTARREPRRWVRRLAWGAVGAVLAQAALGGITVLFFLPTAISVSHAALAELYLCLVVTLAVATSAWWRRAEAAPPPAAPLPVGLAALASGIVFAQILLGAVVRHSGAGLAIPDFPLVFGGLVPERFDAPIAIHYAHRLGAAAVTLTVARLWWKLGRGPRLPRAVAGLMGALVVVQIALGGAVVLTGRSVPVNTLHVATGASLLAASWWLSLTLRRLDGARAPAPAGRLPAVPSRAEGLAS